MKNIAPDALVIANAPGEVKGLIDGVADDEHMWTVSTTSGIKPAVEFIWSQPRTINQVMILFRGSAGSYGWAKAVRVETWIDGQYRSVSPVVNVTSQMCRIEDLNVRTDRIRLVFEGYYRIDGEIMIHEIQISSDTLIESDNDTDRGIAISRNEAEKRSQMSLNGIWRLSEIFKTKTKIADADDRGLKDKWYLPEYADAQWKAMNVPQALFAGELNRMDEEHLLVWYRHRFQVPEYARNQRVLITCNGVAYKGELWVNGEKVGQHEGIFTPFTFDITDRVRIGKENVLALKVTFDRKEVPTSFYTGNDGFGVYQPVLLEFVPSVYVQRVMIHPRLATSDVDFDAWLVNTTGSDFTGQLTAKVQPWKTGDIEKTETADISTPVLKPGINHVKGKVHLTNPRHWSPEDPYLYDLVLTLSDSDHVTECRKTRFGFREFSVKGTEFYLNGKKIYLFGSHWWSTAKSVETMYDWMTRKKMWDRFEADQIPKTQWRIFDREILMTYKSRPGYNLMRTIHCPKPEASLAVADEVGMMINHSLGWEGTHLDKTKKELEEWLAYSYNHPSVVMFTLSNEVIIFKGNDSIKPHEELLDYAKTLEKTGRPFCTSAGLLWQDTRASKPTKSDFYDDHLYPEWWDAGVYLANTQNHFQKMYGRKIDKPIYASETTYYDWMPIGELPPENKALTIDEYLKYANLKENRWWVGRIGLRQAGLLMPDEDRFGGSLGKSLEEDIVNELIRRTDCYQGFAPWHNRPRTRPAFQPIFACGGEYDRNLFAGQELKMKLMVMNDSQNDLKSPSIQLSMTDDQKNQVWSHEIKFEILKTRSRWSHDLAEKIPTDLKTGFYTLSFAVYDGSTRVSQNKNELFIADADQLSAKLSTSRKVGVLNLKSTTQAKADIQNILQDLGITFSEVRQPKDIDRYEVLIVPSLAGVKTWQDASVGVDAWGKAIRQWMEKGGRLVCMEQTVTGKIPWLPEMYYEANDQRSFMDMAVSDHPVFSGLIWKNFMRWNDRHGILTGNVIKPLCENAIGVVGKRYGLEISMGIVEARIGRGSCLHSQIFATERYKKDSSATLYIQNLFHYVLTQDIYKDVRLLGLNSPQTLTVGEKDQFLMVDLRKYVNMGFEDEQAFDQKGGWIDEGIMDLRTVPLGMQKFQNIPFQIIDPRDNEGRSCLVLRGQKKPFFPTSVSAIPIGGEVNYLAFLHTASWCDESQVMTYIVHYGDGSKQEIPIRGKKEINDWFWPTNAENAVVAWSARHADPGVDHVMGFHLYTWTNPHPKKTIDRLDVISGNTAVPVLLAITGIRCSDEERLDQTQEVTNQSSSEYFLGGNVWLAQSVVPKQVTTLTKVGIAGWRAGEKPLLYPELILELRADHSGKPGTVLATAKTPLTKSRPHPNWADPFIGFSIQYDRLETGKRYWLVVRDENRENFSDWANAYHLIFTDKDAYADGQLMYSTDWGHSWNPGHPRQKNLKKIDLGFQVYGKYGQ